MPTSTAQLLLLPLAPYLRSRSAVALAIGVDHSLQQQPTIATTAPTGGELQFGVALSGEDLASQRGDLLPLQPPLLLSVIVATSSSRSGPRRPSSRPVRVIWRAIAEVRAYTHSRPPARPPARPHDRCRPEPHGRSHDPCGRRSRSGGRGGNMDDLLTVRQRDQRWVRALIAARRRSNATPAATATTATAPTAADTAQPAASTQQTQQARSKRRTRGKRLRELRARQRRRDAAQRRSRADAAADAWRARCVAAEQMLLLHRAALAEAADAAASLADDRGELDRCAAVVDALLRLRAARGAAAPAASQRHRAGGIDFAALAEADRRLCAEADGDADADAAAARTVGAGDAPRAADDTDAPSADAVSAAASRLHRDLERARSEFAEHEAQIAALASSAQAGVRVALRRLRRLRAQSRRARATPTTRPVDRRARYIARYIADRGSPVDAAARERLRNEAGRMFDCYCAAWCSWSALAAVRYVLGACVRPVSGPAVRNTSDNRDGSPCAELAANSGPCTNHRTDRSRRPGCPAMLICRGPSHRAPVRCCVHSLWRRAKGSLDRHDRSIAQKQPHEAANAVCTRRVTGERHPWRGTGVRTRTAGREGEVGCDGAQQAGRIVDRHRGAAPHGDQQIAEPLGGAP